MSCEITSDICSKIVIAINLIKKCNKQRPDKDKIVAILNSAYGLATYETFDILNNMEKCCFISLKHYDRGPPSYVIVDQDSVTLKGDFSQDETMKKRSATAVGIQDEALPQLNAISSSQRNINQLEGKNVGNDKVCNHGELQSVSNCELDTRYSQKDSFLSIFDGINTPTKGKEHRFLVDNSRVASLLGIIQKLVDSNANLNDMIEN